MQATLYSQVLGDPDKAATLFAKLKASFPNSRAAAAIDREAKTAATVAALVGKPAPELHFKWSNREGLKTLADLRGKVVVLDFWATWCGPCVASFPNVRELTAHYQGADVAVIGVTSIQGAVNGLGPTPINTKGDPQKELALMTDYIKAKEITWSIAVSEEEVFNPDYGIHGIPHMVIIAPDGTVRHSGLHPAIPLEEKTSKIDAILKEFSKPLPAAAAKS
jgi:thiol-disulfide isomerase/thioredoxin